MEPTLPENPPDGDALPRLEEAAPDVDLSALRRGLDARLAVERGAPGELRALSTTRRRTVALFVTLGTAVAVLTLTRRADLLVYPLPRYLLELGLFGGLLALAGRALLVPGGTALPSLRVVVIAAAAAFLVPALWSLLPIAHEAHQLSVGGEAGFGVREWKCFVFGVATAAPLWLVLAALRRQDREARAEWLLAGAAAGLLGTFALHLHCPLVLPGHLSFGHAPVAPTLLTASLVVGLVTARRS